MSVALLVSKYPTSSGWSSLLSSNSNPESSIILTCVDILSPFFAFVSQPSVRLVLQTAERHGGNLARADRTTASSEQFLMGLTGRGNLSVCPVRPWPFRAGQA